MNNRILIFLLALGAFLAGTAELVVVGVVDLIASDLRVSRGMSGQLVTVFSIAFAAGSPIVISLTSGMNRKRLMLATLFFSIAGNLLAWLSRDIVPLMLSRVILGVTAGVFTVIAFTTAANLSAPEKRGSAIGSVHVGFSGSLVIGVPLGIYIAGHWGWESIFGLLAVANAVIALLMVKLLPRMPGEAAVPLRAQAAMMKQGKVLGGLAITFLCVFGYSICYTFLAPYLQQLARLDLKTVSWLLLLMGICGMLGSRFGGYGTDKWGAKKLLLGVLAVHAVVLLLSPLLATTLPGAVVLIVVWGISAWATVPAIQYDLISLVPESAGIAVSVNTSVFQFGIALGAAAGGVVTERLAVGHVGWIGGIVVFAALLAAAASFSARGRSEGSPALRPNP
ncbi:MFS transporter [Cohnella sp. REN36]|uniref:MFS transporter n=1 Tax=Cohnella sp. REN36 TaxID=2887347 RepID=UPI001D14948E|nr:MFS transporter [Cohnella sp. REN36]MCC3372623.1 MFS transporter [Cohnella sp. REN36]